MLKAAVASLLIFVTAGVLMGPTVSEQYGAAAWRWIKGKMAGEFNASFYAIGSNTGGIIEAYAACVAAGGGTVVIPNGVTTIDGDDLVGNVLLTFDDDETCEVVGYGSPQGVISPSDPKGGSIIQITDAADITVFDVLESGVKISDLSILFAGANSATTGVFCGEVNNFVLENVTMASDGTIGTGAGIGIHMENCLKSVVRDSETTRFATGLKVDGYSNATGVHSSRFRSGGLGIHITDDAAEQEEFTLLDVTVENNERGLLIDGSSSVLLIILDSHFEQVTGTLANRYNIRITSTGGPFIKFVGGSLGPPSGVPANRDYYRTSSASLAFGPDHLTGLNIHNGIECSSSCLSVDVSGSRKITSATGNVFTWTNLYSSSDCPAALVGYTGAVYGMTCSEPDGDVFQCQDIDHASGTNDGICDHADEIVKIMNGGYLTTSDPTDGSDACDTGDRRLNTSNDKLFFCTDGSTDDWYGIQLTDSP